MESGPAYDFDKAFQEWSRVPWDDFGYLDSRDVIGLSQSQFKELLDLATLIRWDTNQWRNKNGSLLNFMDPGRWIGKRILDFGCGYGADSIQFAAHGALVLAADICPSTLLVVQRSLNSYGLCPRALVLIGPREPFLLSHELAWGFDLFWSSGCLHHTPHADRILKEACSRLLPSGECRIIVYSDIRWKQMTGCEADVDFPVWKHPKFQHFVRSCDGVGEYADWYNEVKLKKMVEGFATVVSCCYLFDGQMVGAVVKPGAADVKT